MTPAEADGRRTMPRRSASAHGPSRRVHVRDDDFRRLAFHVGIDLHVLDAHSRGSARNWIAPTMPFQFVLRVIRDTVRVGPDGDDAAGCRRARSAGAEPGPTPASSSSCGVDRLSLAPISRWSIQTASSSAAVPGATRSAAGELRGYVIVRWYQAAPT